MRRIEKSPQKCRAVVVQCVHTVTQNQYAFICLIGYRYQSLADDIYAIKPTIFLNISTINE